MRRNPEVRKTGFGIFYQTALHYRHSCSVNISYSYTFSRHFSLRFSAALGIARTSSVLHSLARKLAAARKRLKYVSSRARVTHLFPRKTLQSSTNSHNLLYSNGLRVCGLHLKPVTYDGFVSCPEIGSYTCNVCAWKALNA